MLSQTLQPLSHALPVIPYHHHLASSSSRVTLTLLIAHQSKFCRKLVVIAMLRYDISELREMGGGAEMRAAEAVERNRSVSLRRVKTWPQLMCCALI